MILVDLSFKLCYIVIYISADRQQEPDSRIHRPSDLQSLAQSSQARLLCLSSSPFLTSISGQSGWLASTFVNKRQCLWHLRLHHRTGERIV